jgi:hypothetical protein
MTPIVYDSQIELPIAADDNKSPIRNQEFDVHTGSDRHIQNTGLPGQMLVMTTSGPKMMFPKITCDGLHGGYGCHCDVTFDDDPSPVPSVQ